MKSTALIVITALTGCSGEDCSEPGTICTVAGSAARTFDPAPAPALEVGLYIPNDVAVDPVSGLLYIIDFNNFVIRELGADGLVRIVAGNGELGELGDGVAVDQPMNHVADLLPDGAGGLYIAAWHNSMVARLDLQSGWISRVAGIGKRTFYTGDGGPALDAALDLPAGLALTPDGRLLITDQANQVIRAIDRRTGVIDRFAGQCIIEEPGACASPVACPGSNKLSCDPTKCDFLPCAPGFGGDGAGYQQARFAFPFGAQAIPGGKLAVGPDGTIYVADCDNARVRALRTDGTIATAAGGGTFELEGAAAAASSLDTPVDVAVAADGTVYFADLYGSCVRRISPEQTLHTVAGRCGTRGFTGDGGPAAEALLDRPLGVALDERGHRLYIADSFNDRIRAVALP